MMLPNSCSTPLDSIYPLMPSDQVKPEKGKAILFYNLLPDGNYDDRSLHAAAPVRKGEKVREYQYPGSGFLSSMS
jgi:hypothetical protein